MHRPSRIAIIVLLSVSLGCAHRIVTTPNLDALNVSSINKIDKSVGYYISPENLKKQVKTPAGGGDKVKYYPYRESEPALNRVLSNAFREVYAVPSPDDAQFISAKNIAYVFVLTIKTNSSSRSSWIWPPSDFTVSLDCKAMDSSGHVVWGTTVTEEAHERLPDVYRDHARAAKVAFEKAFAELQGRIVKAVEFR